MFNVHFVFSFIHETGLAIFFGLVIGAIIRYSKYSGPTFENATLEKSENRTGDNLPDYLELHIPTKDGDANKSSYLYK